MLDNRIFTFLKLCELMNYRKTANALNMTQPAVTQHIHYLESLYETNLFSYSGKILAKTSSCKELEEHARTVVYNELSFRNKINHVSTTKMSIGATKTVGDYLMPETILNLLSKDDITLEVIIDNTKNLLLQLNNLKVDFLMVEGYFDKSKYDYQIIRTEELIGICSINHPFANKTVSLEDTFKEHLIIREEGSGTRDVFEHFLLERNYSYESYKIKSVISSFRIIESAVMNNTGISFVYETISNNNNALATFKIKDSKISHELNYVYLPNSHAKELIKLI